MPSLSTIDLKFCYGHRLLNYDGKCRHLHGHTAKIQLQLDGEQTPDRWEQQRDAILTWIRETLDARMILRRDDPALPTLAELGEVAHLIDCNPTTENIARLIYRQAAELGVPVTQTRMWESPRCSAVYLEDG